MELYYVERNGNKMKMTIPEQDINIPVIVRFHKLLGDCKITIVEDNWDIKDMERDKRKHAEKFDFYSGNLICTSQEVDTKDKWDIANLTDLSYSPDLFARFKDDWNKSFEFWHRTRCRRDGYSSLELGCSLNTTFYYKDVVIDRHINSTIHLFGEGIILTKNITNCLIYDHGKYEVR